MLSNIRKFSKTIFAKILLVIIIIPFIFWGMGGVFSSGNQNSIVKINNHNISTQDFMDYLNNSRIDQKVIRDNIDKEILEQLLSELVSVTLLNMEIKDLNITVSEQSLVSVIKTNKQFLDENNLFSRTKYEKFLLLQNLTAVQFEEKLKKNELKKRLFTYVSGGIQSPLFITNNVYKEQTEKVEIEFIDLETIYKKKEKFTLDEINKYIKLNSEILQEEYIDFSYAKITPKDLIGTSEFNELFFEKIDEIENKISNEINFQELVDDLKIKTTNKKKFKPNDKNNNIEQKIYQKRNKNSIQLIDENEFYVLYEVNNINKTLPSIKNLKFLDKIKKLLFEKNKYEYNKKIFDKIVNKKFTNINFKNLAKSNLLTINQIKLNSIKDNKKFEINSVKLLYTQPVNSFVLIGDEKNNIFLAKITKISKNNISENSEEFLSYKKQANIKIKDSVYKSYDYYIAQKYKVKINEQTLERVKNYFK
jgi:peptidyl-prolyl cis-trans isomerase D